MSRSRALTRTLFAMLSLTAFASARCASRSDAPAGQATADAAGQVSTASPPSDAAPDLPDAPTCSSDLKTDPKNCGRCGHDCLEGACDTGTCQPFILASEQMHPTEIALDATHVYFAASVVSSVLRVPVQGGSVELLTEGAILGSNIAIDDAFVYFMTGGALNGGVARVPKSGGTDGGMTTIATAAYPIAFLAIDDATVFWTGGRFFGGPIQGGVYQAPKVAAAALGNKFNIFGVTAATTSVAVDDTNFYVANAMGRISWMTKTPNGPGGSVASGQTGATGLFADGKRVYWVNAGTGSIVSTEKPGPDAGAGTVTVLAAGQNVPARLAIDDVAIYFTATGSGTIGSCPLSGCTDVVRLVASNQAAPFGIAVDAVAIYWANSGNGTIMKVAK